MIGILHFISNYRFPNNARGTPQYRWTALDQSEKEVSEYLVASSNKYNKNQYVIIEHKTVSKPRPIGVIIKILGEIGNIDVEIEARLYYRNIAFKRWKFNPQSSITSSKLHIDYQNLKVYSIDPVGCCDIDDAFSYQLEEHRIGIHIADVSYLLQEYGLLNIENFTNRYSSVYLPNQVNHMIPDSLGTDQASLLPNQSRFTWTLWLDLSETNEIKKWEFQRTIIKSSKAFSYDEAEDNPEIKEISKIVREMGKNMLQLKYDNWTTHEMIEVLMIIINHLVAKFIYDHFKNTDFKKSIYRTHSQPQKQIENVNDQDLNKILNILNSQSAEYTYDTGNYYHYGLKIDKYTHFSSPIRRFVDVYIHVLLSNILYPNYGKINVTNIELDLEKLNDFNHRVKLFQRDLDKIKLISLIKTDISHQGYVIDINNENVLDVYFPTLKILFSFPLIHKNIIELFQIINNQNHIEISYNYNSIKIEKQKLITFNLYPQIEENSLSKKIKVEIPLLADFLQGQHRKID